MYAETVGAMHAIADEPGELRAMPILLLNLHENCNCRCVMCDIWKRPAGTEFDPQSLRRHQDSIRALGVRHVVLTGGEPLLHSRFSELCALLKECDVKLTLLTTGLLLRAHAKTVAKWVDEIIVSLDGPENVHDSIRRVKRGFELIGTGINAVRQHRRDLRIHARSTVQLANFLFLRETVAAAMQLGFDSISFLPIDASSQAFNRELVWPGERQSEVTLTSSEIALLEDAIERLISECHDEIESRYIVEQPDKLRRIARRFREHLGEQPPQAPTCNAPWVSVVVEVDGSIRPCFFHRFVGSIATVPLGDAVNSTQAKQFRLNLNVADNPVCRRCVCSLNYKGA